jgi:hypothetical protein
MGTWNHEQNVRLRWREPGIAASAPSPNRILTRPHVAFYGKAEPRSDSPLTGIQLATQPDMPGPISRQRLRQPVEYRDRHGRVWRASEVGQLKVVSPSIDGPNLCLVIRFEREGEELFARWLGDSLDWRGQQTLHRLFASADP